MDTKNDAQCSNSSDQQSDMSVDVLLLLPNNNKNKGDHGNKTSSNSVKPDTIIHDDGDNNKTTATKRDESVDKGEKIQHSGKKKKKKVKKVDWTPELHKKFVQAVEQLGVDKEAVPSKILELMGTDCLTRHNVASHLQKYRSHRKHVLAREAETASWNRRRQTHGTVGRTVKKDMSSCVPTTAFPPVAPMPHFRPLHVWGYPPTWAYHHPLPDASFWYSYHHQDVPAPGMPCSFMPRPFTAQPVPGIPNNPMYRVDPYNSVGMPTVFTTQELPKPLCDFDLSKESLDAAIGDVLSKPWLPLPLGLKPPSTDSVMSELQRQGISKIQPDFYLASH